MPDLSPREIILSNDYADFILSSYGDLYAAAMAQESALLQPIPYSVYNIAYLKRSENPPLSIQNYPYQSIPSCYGLMNEESLAQSGILSLHNYPGLDLQGDGVIIGFIDTGINYGNPVFLSETGGSRIYAIWDQTQQEDEPPEGFSFGSIYYREQIEAAIAASNPFSLVPTRDEIGHGTFLASVAAGSPVASENFVGAAPKADIIMVKCKPAKAYLKEYYRIPESALAYQENDIMLGIRFLLNMATQAGKPLVICLGLGTSTGDHTGASPLAGFLNFAASYPGIGVVVCTGNEADAQHHFRGQIASDNDYEEVELRVGENSYGFTLELWAASPNLYTVALISPSGESVPRIPARLGQSDELTFVFDSTRIFIDYDLAEMRSGSQLIQLRFVTPSPGVWRLRIYGSSTNIGPFDIWLPIRNFIENDTYFLKPDALITLTDPSTAEQVITVGAYQASNVSLFLESGRGFNRNGLIKPDFLSPGVNILGTIYPGRFEAQSGTSMAAAIASGALALLFNWAYTLGNDPDITTAILKNYLIRGADRKDFLSYPNEAWGYGTLNLFQTLARLRIQ